jgi:inositol hexakisphosphate/diphosphoinositol-pentakisphosphate kinase
MKKKAASKPMKAILKLICESGRFEIRIFEEEVILNAPIEEWPHPVDSLICFFSEGFPLEKAEAYISLRRLEDRCINKVPDQRILWNRKQVYTLLEQNGVNHPNAIFVERDAETKELVGLAPEEFVEGDDFIKVGSRKISKPFVEKPFDAEDHNICIYYPSSAGGGVKRLFRKIGDRASDFDSDGGRVRRDGSYIYEPFMQTQGTDIKVYTVGPEYAHAEARKSPVIDGKVIRNDDGKEMRTPVILTPEEKNMAKVICEATQQFICGFDLLRTPEGSFVIDVNGWSFVKSLPKYYEDASIILCAKMMEMCGLAPSPRIERLVSSRRTSAASREGSRTALLSNDKSGGGDTRWVGKELLAVLAVVRHGDRTPKNKMKMTTVRNQFIQLHTRWSSGPRKEVKLKSPKQLQEVLDLTHTVLGRSIKKDHRADKDKDSKQSSDSDDTFSSDPDGSSRPVRSISLDENEREACNLIASVLEAGGHFGGVYRKIQLKPLAWNEEGQVEKLMLILKYGGVLTPAGIAQAEELGHHFRTEMYPNEPGAGGHSTGLLRLHATQRHDFKVYSSDEGRVQVSAAAFVRGLLDLEKGPLTPICVALVENDSKMLDTVTPGASKKMDGAKVVLHRRLLDEPDDAATTSPSEVDQTTGSREKSALITLLDAVKAVVDEVDRLDPSTLVKEKCADGPSPSIGAVDASSEQEGGPPVICETVSFDIVRIRWHKLYGELYDTKKACWNISKVPEIFDAVKYDMIHCPRMLKSQSALYDIAKQLNDQIVPNEYGYDAQSRLDIGSSVCGRLLTKLIDDLKFGRKSVLIDDQPQSKIVTAVEILKNFVSRIPNPWSRSGNTDAESARDTPSATPEAAKKEAEFAGLDGSRAPDTLKSPERRVRTRLYFTSESHIQSLMNILRYCQYKEPSSRPAGSLTDSSRDTSLPSSGSSSSSGIVLEAEESKLCEQPIFDYLTQIVFRLYEDKDAPIDSAERYLVEVLFSPGAAGHPAQARNHIMPMERLRPLHHQDNHLPLARLLKLLERCSDQGQAEDDSPVNRFDSSGQLSP